MTLQKHTINDVAKLAGVSKKTVSRVLNEEANVRESTRLVVMQAVESLGYKPNPQARGLASNQSFLIGLIYDNPNKSYVSDVQEGALTACEEHGYHLLIQPMIHDQNDVVDKIESLIYSSRLDGLILTQPFSDNKSLNTLLKKINLPYARIAPTEMMDDSLNVVCNDVESAYQMTRYLISLGHIKIGFIVGHPDHPVSQQRLNGYIKALQENKIEYDAKYVQQGFFDFNSGEDCARRLLSLEERPTAIFASNDYMAAGVLKVASQKQISVPHQLSVAGYDNAPISSYIWPALTTVKQPVTQQALMATTLLIQTIRKKMPEETTINLENKLIIRESTAPF